MHVRTYVCMYACMYLLFVHGLLGYKIGMQSGEDYESFSVIAIIVVVVVVGGE